MSLRVDREETVEMTSVCSNSSTMPWSIICWVCICWEGCWRQSRMSSPTASMRRLCSFRSDIFICNFIRGTPVEECKLLNNPCPPAAHLPSIPHCSSANICSFGTPSSKDLICMQKEAVSIRPDNHSSTRDFSNASRKQKLNTGSKCLPLNRYFFF